MGRLTGLTAATLLVLCGHLLDEPRCAAQKPLPAGPNAYTVKEFNRNLEAFHKQRLEAYEKFTEDPADLRAAGREFLTAVIAAGGTLRFLDATDNLYKQGSALLKQGSQDPLVLAATALAAGNRLPAPELREMVRKARERLAQSKYPARQRAEVFVRTHTVLVNLDSHKQGNAVPDLLETAAPLAAWFAEAGDGDAPRFVWRAVSNYFENGNWYLQRPTIDAVRKTKDVHPWLLNMLEGHVTMMEGFRIDVTTAVKRERQRSAAVFLRRAYEIEPRFPEAATDMILIARDGQDDTAPRVWFDRAVAAEFDWPDAYKNYQSVLHPRHGGSIDKLLEFGLECVASKRYDTTVPYQLSDMLRMVEETVTNGPYPAMWSRPDLYRAEVEVAEGAAVAKEYGGKPFDDDLRQWVRACQVAFAVRANRYDEIAPLLKLTQEHHLRRAFKMYSVTESPQEVAVKAAAAGKPGSAFRDLELLFEAVSDQRSAAAALARVEKLLKEAADPSGKDFLENWRAALRIYRDFYAAKPEWVDISFPSQLVRGAEGWSVEPDGVLVTTTKLGLNWDALRRLNPPYELSCSITVEQFVPRSESAGIFIGPEDNLRFRAAGRGFGVAPKDGLALVTGGPCATRSGKLPKLPAGPVQLHVKLWPTYAELFVNDIRICATHLQNFESAGRFALGVWRRYDENDMPPFKAASEAQRKPGAANDKEADEPCRIRFQNLRIRRLELAAPPRNNPRTAIVHFTKLIEQERDNPHHLLDRATAYADTGRPRAGLADVEGALKLLPNSSAGRLRRAELLTQVGEYQAASDLLAVLIKEDRNDWRAHDELAWLQATCPDEKFRNARQALRAASDAWKLADSADKWSLSVSWTAALAELGHFEEGQKVIDRAQEWITTDPAPRHANRIDQVQRALDAKQPVRSEIIQDELPVSQPSGGKSGAGKTPTKKKAADKK